jgi:hypothetical protein
LSSKFRHTITFVLLLRLALIHQLETRYPREKAGSIQGLGGRIAMWIFDSYFKGSVELWSRERGLERISIAYTSSFYMHRKILMPMGR